MMSNLEIILAIIIVCLLMYIYFRALPLQTVTRTNPNGGPVELMVVSDTSMLMGTTIKGNPAHELNPVYFPNGYRFHIGPMPLPPSANGKYMVISP